MVHFFNIRYISYDTDLLALEGLVPYTGKWIEYASKRDNLLIEIRTKSANYSSISSYSPVSNVILAWTLSPQKIIDDYEHLTPNLDARLKCADMAIKDGWKVRLSFEPIIKINGWKEVYAKFMDHVFSIIQPEKLYDINIGTFRMNKDYFKKIGRSRTDTDLFSYPISFKNGVAGYEDEDYIGKYVGSCAAKYFDKKRIYGI